MKISEKKLSIADKMYKQNSTGGVGKSLKEYMNGKNTKGDLKMKFKMNGKGSSSSKGQKFEQANTKGSFNSKYNQANSKGSFKGGYNQ